MCVYVLSTLGNSCELVAFIQSMIVRKNHVGSGLWKSPHARHKVSYSIHEEHAGIISASIVLDKVCRYCAIRSLVSSGKRRSLRFSAYYDRDSMYSYKWYTAVGN